jgi:chloramphenicol 3-O phosphotransferase
MVEVMTSQIILLHGASSSGKSPVARALQAAIERPFWHVSIDHLRDAGVLPMARFACGDFRWAEARRAIFDGFHASLGAYADTGNSLIVEHIIGDMAWMSRLRQVFAGHDLFFVAIHCSAGTLIQREMARGDRPAESAMRDFRTIHVGRVYDLEVHSEDGVDANIRAILSAWRSGKRVSEFQSRAIG